MSQLNAKPTKVFFFCDESGAKGYSDKDESYPGEVGVFSGILLPSEVLPLAAPVFQAIYDRFKPVSGKLHIADLTSEQQQALRKEIYEAIKSFSLPCFWYAIHVAGFHHQHKFLLDLRKATKDEKRESPPRVKRGSPRENPMSLHIELFGGLYAHLIAFLAERKRTSVDIEILSDQIDGPLTKDFEEIAKELLKSDPLVKQQTGFDTVTKKPVKGTIIVQTQLPPELDIDMTVSSLSITASNAPDGLVLAADVLSNSINHLFKNRKDDKLYMPLNCPEAVSEHPLAEHLDAFVDWGTGELVGDCLYRHPKARVL